MLIVDHLDYLGSKLLLRVKFMLALFIVILCNFDDGPSWTVALEDRGPLLVLEVEAGTLITMLATS